MTAPARFDYIRDDARRRIRITAQQPLQAADLIFIVERQISEGTWTYSTLYDLRAVDRGITREDAILIAERVQTYVTTHGPRGPVALVTRSFDMVGFGQMYALDGLKGGFKVEVFWDLDDAEAWLARQPPDR